MGEQKNWNSHRNMSLKDSLGKEIRLAEVVDIESKKKKKDLKGIKTDSKQSFLGKGFN